YKQKWAEYQNAVGALRKAMTAQPYGAPDRVSSAAAALADWIGADPGKGLLAEMAKRDYDEAASKRMLGVVARQWAEPAHDYASARQLLWAYRVIYDELTKGVKKAPPDPAVDALLARFAKELKLDLKAGRGEISPFKTNDKSDLNQTLKALGAYD